MKHLVLLAALLLAAALPAAAQINYQGRLTDASGNPLADGQYTLEFSLWDNATAGVQVWGPYTLDGSAGKPKADLVSGCFNVGIGTTSPLCLLDVGGSTTAINTYFSNLSYYRNLQGGGNNFSGYANVSLSIRAAGAVKASVYFVNSDSRIKHIEGRSSGFRDLETLSEIEITDYTYIDSVTKGPGKQKKVIAQQVETVNPQAVSRATDAVPDIYQKAEFKDGNIIGEFESKESIPVIEHRPLRLLPFSPRLHDRRRGIRRAEGPRHSARIGRDRARRRDASATVCRETRQPLSRPRWPQIVIRGREGGAQCAGVRVSLEKFKS